MSPTNNDGDTTNRDEFNEPIQCMNDSNNNNPIPFTIGVYNQKPITYKPPYTLFVSPITSQYTSSRYANIKYCLFYVNHTFASNDYAWDIDELYKMSIN